MARLNLKNIFSRLWSVASWIMTPVIKEFNFFFVIWLINSSVTLGNLVGCFFFPDNDLMQGLRCLALSTVVTYLITLILYLLRKRGSRIAFKVLCYTVIVALEVVYAFLMLNFDMALGPRVLILLAETNAKETSEFISTYFLTSKSLWAYAASVAIILAVALIEWKKELFNKFAATKAMRIVLAIIFLPLLLWGAYLSHNYVRLGTCSNSKELKQWLQDFGVDALDHLTTTYYSLCYLKVSDADIAHAVAVARAVEKSPVSVSEPDSLNVVMVLGESYIKSHASLYGYPLNTTPLMCAERDKGNLVAFTDIVTPFNATSQVEKNFFALNDFSREEMWYEKPIFPTVFKHAGYKVFFWDNQRNYAKKEMFTITVNSFIYNDTIAGLSYDETSSVGILFDNDLISNFLSKSKVKPGKYNLYIFHLMGQHVHPVGRYPKKKGFDVFNAGSIKRKDSYLDKDKLTYIAQYDNATYYNDAVIKHIFDLWRDKNTVVLYFSDHGDEAYDYRDHCGRGNVTVPNASLLHCQNDVPFVVWASDYYISHHKQLFNQIKSAANRPGVVLDASNLLLRLAGINTPYYLPYRDISSSQYEPYPRIVFDKYDYDEVIKSSKEK